MAYIHSPRIVTDGIVMMQFLPHTYEIGLWVEQKSSKTTTQQKADTDFNKK